MAPAQNPNVKLSPETKSTLDNLKKSPSQTYDYVITSLVQKPLTQSASTPTINFPQQKTAGVSAGSTALFNFTRILGWISDTKKKLPRVTSETRIEAYNQDALVRGIIMPFLRDVLFSGYLIETADNKKFAALIKDGKKFLEDIQLMGVFKEDFKDLCLIYGHSYRRKDYAGQVLRYLQRLEPGSMRTYEDPFDSSIVAYHQSIYVPTSWSRVSPSRKLINSWFIPGGKRYIPEEQVYDPAAKAIWEVVKEKYNISDISGLRVDSADKILAMHTVSYRDNNQVYGFSGSSENKYMYHQSQENNSEPAPIDSVILDIWLKKLVMANGPNFIFRVLIPFLHIQNGIIVESTDKDGNKIITTSVPQAPNTLDPELKAAQQAQYDAYVTALQDDPNAIIRGMAEGGAFSSGPDKKVNVIESGRSISPAFIETMIRLLNENIGQAFGFPVSLILASGSQLATSRVILEVVNSTHAGSRAEHEAVADSLLKERFAGQTWNYELTRKDGTIETGTYTFEDAEAHFKLASGDVKDMLQKAQTELATMQALQVAKTLGASKADIQALADERGFGLLDLTKFDTVAAPTGMFGIQSTGKQDLKPEDIPKNEDEKLKDELLAAYQEAKKNIGKLFEGE